MGHALASAPVPNPYPSGLMTYVTICNEDGDWRGDAGQRISIICTNYNTSMLDQHIPTRHHEQSFKRGAHS